MTRASILLILVAACCAPPPAVRAPNVLLLKNVANIPGHQSVGSGVVIAHGWILTAKHVLPVTSAGGHPITGAFLHPELDLALLQAPGVIWRGTMAAERLPLVYDRLHAYGWHAAATLLKTEGFQGRTIGTMSADVYHGCSGGAITNDRGELVGIIKTMGLDVSDYEVILPISHISGYTPLTPAVLDWIRNILP